MNIQTSVSKFNNLAEEFLNKMIKTFPDEKKLSVYLIHFKTTKTFSSKKPAEFFTLPLIPYAKQLMSKDEKFFKKDELVNGIESFSEQTGLIDRWESMTPKIKESIWNYLQSLLVLGMMVLNRQQELQNIISLINSD